jgi:hypothetical protein
MPPTDTLVLLTAAAFVAIALMLMGFELERRNGRRVLAAALLSPQSVEKAWISAPDESGMRCLFVKAVGVAREHAVAVDHEVDDVLHRFTLAGIPVRYEEEDEAGA